MQASEDCFHVFQMDRSHGSGVLTTSMALCMVHDSGTSANFTELSLYLNPHND